MQAKRHNRFRLHTSAGSVVATLLLAATGTVSLGAQQALSVAAMPRVALRYEVATEAIAAALATEGLTLAPDRLHLAMPLNATSPTPKLHVAGAELEQDGSLRLRLICRAAGECMPFFATVAMADHDAALATLAGLQGKPLAPSIHGSPTLLPATIPQSKGIAVGARITLELTDAQMRIHLPAVAIDTGAPGTEVRVASLDRKHTWRGIVLDANTVQGGMQ